jgi:hypothetical protein
MARRKNKGAENAFRVKYFRGAWVRDRFGKSRIGAGGDRRMETFANRSLEGGFFFIPQKVSAAFSTLTALPC